MKLKILCILTLNYLCFYSQNLGISITNEVTDVEIQPTPNDLNDKLLKITNSDGKEIFNVTTEGNVGVGVAEPKAGIDLRSDHKIPLLGIGSTNLSPEILGDGVIRYVPGISELQVSVNNSWYRFTSNLERPFLVAANNYIAGTYPNDQSTVLDGFTVIKDSYNAFDINNSTYTIPMDGVYVFSFTISFAYGQILADSYIEASWIASNGYVVKSIQYFPVQGNGMGSITCSGSMKLLKGYTLTPKIYHNLGTEKKLRVYGSTPSQPESDLNYNNLYIFAQ
ncbi:hypothetical protein ETU08_10250 [Apibacter muscae]|uniref:hypothetical protein n=1 Tax=Apibacter muscae TaxID=2509004 RepID=UPI0011ABEA29|nr:hypothetical protein [Apibacter muscae]TWP28083.1 hypothetical protein ETU08_10250 [Apibacter muscae]